MNDEQKQTLQKLLDAINEASANGLLDELAAEVHPDTINAFVDAVADFAETPRETTAIPVLFETDDNGEANGTIHPYCSESCRDANLEVVTYEALKNGFGIVTGQAPDLDDIVCEQCGKRI